MSHRFAAPSAIASPLEFVGEIGITIQVASSALGFTLQGGGIANVDPSAAGPHLTQDGFGNDFDGVADFPGDPRCTSGTDASERETGHVCDDGIDNDGEGVIDYPADPGCDSASDASEQSASLACDDGFDNDGDGLVDFDDPVCTRSWPYWEKAPGLLRRVHGARSPRGGAERARHGACTPRR